MSSPYNKAIAGLLGGFLPFLALFFPLPAFLQDPQTITAIAGVLAGLMVYIVPNKT